MRTRAQQQIGGDQQQHPATGQLQADRTDFPPWRQGHEATDEDNAAQQQVAAPVGDHAGRDDARNVLGVDAERSEEHTSELQSLMRISYAVFCLKKKKKKKPSTHYKQHI